MNYKGILIDLDHTLYNYEVVHEEALKKTLEKFSNQYELSYSESAILYEQSKTLNHRRLQNTAASHNRLIYFQLMLEAIGSFDIKQAMAMDDTYWAYYYDCMKPDPYVMNFFQEIHLPKCIVTDFNIRPQYEKLVKLRVDEWVDYIVSSEEAGHEKPHPYVFMLALQKLGLQPHECLMIGDSYKKDCLGASALGIDSIFYKGDYEKADLQKGIYVMQDFNEIIEWLNK